MAIYELDPAEMGRISPSETNDLVAGTQEILQRHGLPAHLEFAYPGEVPRREVTGTLLRHFEAINTGFLDIYNVNVSLLGAVKAKDRHVINIARFMIDPTDVTLDPEAFSYLARDITGSRIGVNPLLLTSNNLLADLGRSVRSLARASLGQDVIEGEHWIVTDRKS